MSEFLKYWKLVKIDAAAAGQGFRLQPIPQAQQVLQRQFSELASRSHPSETTVQTTLLQLAQAQPVRAQVRVQKAIGTRPDRATTEAHSAAAELCLRCYVSHAILHACVKRARLFGAGDRFTYRDLLPFVLTDDGRSPLGQYIPFSVEIVRSFSPERKCSLTGWADIRVKRNPELNQFLLEYGLRFSSDWALLNQVKPKHYSSPDSDMIAAFHAVYRRHRLQSRRGTSSRCAEPTEDQLREMMQFLRDRTIWLQTSQELKHHLKRIAALVRQESIWGQRGTPIADSLDITDPDTEETVSRDIPDLVSPLDLAEAAERSQVHEFVTERLIHCLDEGIRQGIDDRIRHLQQRSRYAHLASQVKRALRLLYFEGKSQGQIASALGMTNQSQVSRVLDLKGLLIEIRRHTLEKLLGIILEKVNELGLIDLPAQPDYLSNLMQQLDEFVDERVFRAAVAELATSKNRAMESLYAQRLRQYLSNGLSNSLSNS